MESIEQFLIRSLVDFFKKFLPECNLKEVEKALKEFMKEDLKVFSKQSPQRTVKESLEKFPKDFQNKFLEKIKELSLVEF